MKIKHTNKDDFTPIKLELTIESEDELLSIYHRLNNPVNFESTSTVKLPSKAVHGNDCTFFKALFSMPFDNPKYERKEG